MKKTRNFVSFVLVLVMLIPMFSFNAGATGEPQLAVDNFTFTLTEADSIKDMRYAPGVYTTTSEIKAAEGNVALSNAIVTKNTVDGIFSYVMPYAGYYTLWVRMKDGTNYILPLDITDITPYVTSYGVKVTLHNLYDVKDFYIAKGEYNTYREIKDNGYIVSATGAKIDTKHEYTYTVHESGVHTVLIRYNDGTQALFHEVLTVEEPVFTENGLQVIVSNIPDVKVIRTAYGTWSSTKELKATDTIRNFSSKTSIKGKDPYTIQYREEGDVTVIVEYNNGYVKVFHYTVAHRAPELLQDGGRVSFSGLDGLQVIRYAPGEFTSSTDIKNAPGNMYIRPEAAKDGVISVDLEPGTYTFCVQYNDESFNYYTITVEEHAPVVPEATATGIKVSSAFSDDMMLQRDEKLSVWGTAASCGGTVVVELDGRYAWCEVDENGRWKASFDTTFSYTTDPLTLTVSGGEEDIVYNNVLIGDVYYIIGQSNVFYSMTMLTNELAQRGEPLVGIDYDDNRNMRFFRISSMDYNGNTGVTAQGTETVYTDIFTDRPWLTPSDIGYDVTHSEDNTFSALGYLYAFEMVEKTDIPVGIIEIDASGCPLISFAPNQLAEKWGHELYSYADGTYHHKIDEVEDETVKTRFMYNQAIYPLSHFSTAGIIWYQGESDWYNVRDRLGIDSDNYFVPQFVELMNYFRSTFGNSDFPIYMVELPSCYSNYGNNAFIDYGDIRAEMGDIPQLLSDCYMISSSDLWFDVEWQNNIHPPIKAAQASRLSSIVCAQKGLSDSSIDDVHGPILENVEYTSTGATLSFIHTGSGLGVAHPEILGTELKGIEARIMYNGYPEWIDVTGETIVDGSKIVLDIGQEIYGVRYHALAEKNYPFGVNLCNSYGMPALAFVNYSDKVIPEPDPNEIIPTATNVRVSNAFSDNMVLQRDAPLSVWGFGDPDGTVVVNLGGRNASAKVERDGTWKATFDGTFEYNIFGQPLTVRSAGPDIVINNVLIGDVYFLIGQSNVYYSLGEQKIDLALKNMSDRMNVDYNDGRNIRFFRISSTDFSNWTGPVAQGTKVKFNDVYNNSTWMKPSDIEKQIKEYADFIPNTENYNRYEVSKHVYSALGYQFAFDMCTRSPIPVGVIEIDASGCPLITFAPNELADKWGHDVMGEDGTYHYKLNDIIEYPTTKSRFAYNQMIYPLSGFSTAGIIWYQGESDQYNIRQYFGSQYTNGFPQQFTELMTYFRNSFGNSDFPIFMIEMPPCYSNNNANAYMDFGGVRAELGTIPQLLSNCHIISSSDLWYDNTWWNNLHPYIKYSQAARLSEVVYQYHTMRSNLELVLGPQLSSVEYVSDSKAILTFDHVGFGLTTAMEDGYVRGIEVLIEVNGETFWNPHEGNVIISHNTIVIDTGSFKLHGVRYNATTEKLFPHQLTLCNSYKMPAIAFVDYRK